ncbi:MAG: putative toxin-antitoxin system toxin component, PIN family [Rhodoferax ferrireducens]|uniref:Putative toxin-antitoxin system toxin component, PIN family n=2 Tax=Pseudomonadota TaxID=1224 RepID=A0A1Y1QZV6_9GAMM|nr:MAG: putative toxin-antitoxin system toxin component, PIN family [Rhodoferax ferrireducens]OQX17196.1 MAG: putative toxin-antitoxin system toxin component, PIN family [Thiothrix lacustris]
MIVIDTNVFVGACMGTGASARVIELCLLGQVAPAMGSALLMEFEDVLSHTALFEGCRLNATEREELLDIFLAQAKWVKTYFSWRPNLRDEGDNHVLELAVACAASHIVTWNTRDFSSMELRFPQLSIVTPPDFLKETTA